MELGRDSLKLRFWLLGLVFLPLLAPMVAAAPEAPGGLRAAVTDNTANPGPQFVELRFTLSPDDPDQDVGSYQYNVTVDAGSPVDLGDVALNANYVAGDGFVTFAIEWTGPTVSADYWIHAWDGMDEGPDSCIVTVHNGIFADYDSCGTLVTTWQEIDCLPASGSVTGWNFEQGVDRVERDGRPSFRYNKPFFSDQAVSGLNLGGDSGSMRWDFEIASDRDGLSSQIQFFFSEVVEGASKSSGGNFESTGAFRNGFGVLIREFGNGYDVIVFSNREGTSRTIFSDTFTAGIDANEFETGYFAINEWAAVAELNIGSETVFFSLGSVNVGASISDEVKDLQTLWAVGLRTGTQFLARDGSPGLCVSTLSAAQGGSVEDVGLEGLGGDGIPGFGGEGGLGGDPMFPGMDIDSQADALGMEVEGLALLLGGLLLVLLTAAGFLYAKGTGAGIGAILGLALAAVFNLFPLWILVIVFLLAAAALVLARPGGA